jgi:prophage regulatory protein
MPANAARLRETDAIQPAGLQSPNTPCLLPLEEVMGRVHMCRTAVYGRIKKGSFPAPAKVGSSSRWLSTEIDEWIAAVMRSRRPAPASGTAAAHPGGA